MSPYRSSADERAPPQPTLPITSPACSAEAPAPATWAAQYADALPTLIAALGGATSLSIRVPPPGSTDAMELTWTLARSAADGDTMPAGLAEPAGHETPSRSSSTSSSAASSSSSSSSSSLVSLLLTPPSSPSIAPSAPSRIHGLPHAQLDEGHGSRPSRRRAPSATATVTPLRRQPPRERRLPLRLQGTDAIEAIGWMLPRSSARTARRSRTFGRTTKARPSARGRKGSRGSRGRKRR